VVIGKAPDMFEGNMMPELYLAAALGAVGKPMFRVHTAGSVGGSTALVAAHLITAGIHRRVLTVAYEKQSDSDAMWALSVPQPFAAPLLAGAGGYFAPHIRAYIRRSGAPDHIGRMVAVKDRQNAMRNPYAHLHLADIDMKMVEDSMMLWDPLRYLEACPSSDGAAAMVLSAEGAVSGRFPPAWVHGMAMRSEPTMFAGRDQVNPQAGRDCSADVYAQAGITEPRAPAFDGDIPWNTSGGVLSSNPIGASGMLRFLEVAMQVRGQAGEHQVDGARLAFGQAYGGGSQFFSMWVVGSDKP
jgi:acetyl-CoA C-acetyltransferase